MDYSVEEEEDYKQPDASEDGFNQPDDSEEASQREDDSYVLLPSSNGSLVAPEAPAEKAAAKPADAKKPMSSSKFTQMIEDAANEYRIPHYGDLSNNSHYEVVKPCLVGNKYVAYVVRGEDQLEGFEATRRYNEFYTLRHTIC